jgi:hypothetical protein
MGSIGGWTQEGPSIQRHEHILPPDIILYPGEVEMWRQGNEVIPPSMRERLRMWPASRSVERERPLERRRQLITSFPTFRAHRWIDEDRSRPAVRSSLNLSVYYDLTRRPHPSRGLGWERLHLSDETIGGWE